MDDGLYRGRPVPMDSGGLVFAAACLGRLHELWVQRQLPGEEKLASRHLPSLLSDALLATGAGGGNWGGGGRWGGGAKKEEEESGRRKGGRRMTKEYFRMSINREGDEMAERGSK